MEDSQKKGLIVAGICLVVAIVVTFAFNNPFAGSSGGSGGEASAGPMLMKCSECGHTFEISREKYMAEVREALKKQGKQMISLRMGERVAITCPDCGRRAAYQAKKCPECGYIFILDYSDSDDYPDRCPECGYSEYESQSDN